MKIEILSHGRTVERVYPACPECGSKETCRYNGVFDQEDISEKYICKTCECVWKVGK